MLPLDFVANRLNELFWILQTLGSDHAQTPTHRPYAHVVRDGPDTFTAVTYVRLIGAPDLTFTPEFSPVPDPWGFSASGFTEIGVVNNGDGTEKVTLRDNTPVTPGNPRFVRIWVDLN